MDKRLEEVEARVVHLEQMLRQVEGRVAELEGVRGALASAIQSSAQPESEGAAEDTAGEAAHEWSTFASWLSLTGRSCLVLGGAFLVRALTDASVVPRELGVALGVAYALSWIVMGDLAGARGRLLSSAFHGVSATIIAFPLVWEAVTTFKVLSPLAAASVILGVTALAFAVAWRRSLAVLAWTVTLGAVCTAFGLAVVCRSMEVFSGVLIVLAGACVWLADARGWRHLAWPAVLAANVAVFAMVYLVTLKGGPPASWGPLESDGVLGLALGLFGVTTAGLLYLTLARRREVGVSECLHSLGALVLGLGGAVRVAQAGGQETLLVGLAVLALVLAAACYAVAFGFARRRQPWRRNFVFYASLGLLLCLGATAVVLEGRFLVVCWCAMGLAAATLGARFGGLTIWSLGTVCIVAAGVQGGIFLAAVDAFIRPLTVQWRPVTFEGMMVLACGLLCYGLLWAAQRRAAVAWPQRLPRGALALVSLLGVGAVVISAVGEGLAADPAVLSTIRSGVLAATALSLAAGRKWCGLQELGWFVYPVLLAGGLKLLFEDLRHGEPANLFASFAFFGLSLILAPRWSRRPKPAAPSPAQEPGR